MSTVIYATVGSVGGLVAVASGVLGYLRYRRRAEAQPGAPSLSQPIGESELPVLVAPTAVVGAAAAAAIHEQSLSLAVNPLKDTRLPSLDPIQPIFSSSFSWGWLAALLAVAAIAITALGVSTWDASRSTTNALTDPRVDGLNTQFGSLSAQFNTLNAEVALLNTSNPNSGAIQAVVVTLQQQLAANLSQVRASAATAQAQNQARDDLLDAEVATLNQSLSLVQSGGSANTSGLQTQITANSVAIAKNSAVQISNYTSNQQTFGTLFALLNGSITNQQFALLATNVTANQLLLSALQNALNGTNAINAATFATLATNYNLTTNAINALWNIVNGNYTAYQTAFTTGQLNVTNGGPIYTTGLVSAGSLSVSNNITAIGSVTAGSIVATGIITTSGPIVTAGTVTAASINVTGTVFTNGLLSASTLVVPGVSNLGPVNAGNLIATSINATGNVLANGLIGGASLSVTGTSTLGSVNAGNVIAAAINTTGNVLANGLIGGASLSVTGTSTLGPVNAGNLIAAAINATGTVFTKGLVSGATLSVSGVSTLGSVNAGNLIATNVNATGNVLANGLIGGASLSVTGTSTLGPVNAGNLIATSVTTASINATGNVFTNGLVSATALIVPGVSNLGTVNTGNLVVTGSITSTSSIVGASLSATGGGAIGTTGPLTAGSVTATGVITTSGALTAAGISGTSLTAVTGGAIGTTGPVSGGTLSAATTITSANTITANGALSAASLTAVAGGAISTTGAVSTGTLTATGLITTSSALTAASINVTGTGTIFTKGLVSGGTLSVAGVANMANINAATVSQTSDLFVTTTIGSPVAGQVWFDGTNLNFYNGTTTIQLGGGVTSSSGGSTTSSSSGSSSVAAALPVVVYFNRVIDFTGNAINGGTTTTPSNGLTIKYDGSTNSGVSSYPNNAGYVIQTSAAPSAGNLIQWAPGSVPPGIYKLTYTTMAAGDRPILVISELATSTTLRSGLDLYTNDSGIFELDEYIQFSATTSPIFQWKGATKNAASTGYYILLVNYLQLTFMSPLTLGNSSSSSSALAGAINATSLTVSGNGAISTGGLVSAGTLIVSGASTLGAVSATSLTATGAITTSGALTAASVNVTGGGNVFTTGQLSGGALSISGVSNLANVNALNTTAMSVKYTTTSIGTPVAGQVWFDGTNLKFYNGVTTVSLNGGGSTAYYAYAYLSTNQGINVNSVDTIRLDTLALNSGMTFGSYVITVPVSGSYLITGGIDINSISGGSGSTANSIVMLNGLPIDMISLTLAGDNEYRNQSAFTLRLSAGDTLGLATYCTFSAGTYRASYGPAPNHVGGGNYLTVEYLHA